MATKVQDLSGFDPLEVVCTAYICMEGDLGKMQAWMLAMGRADLAEAAERWYKEINERFLDCRKRVLERIAIRVLYDVVMDPESKQRVEAAKHLLTLANVETASSDSKAMLDELTKAMKKTPKAETKQRAYPRRTK